MRAINLCALEMGAHTHTHVQMSARLAADYFSENWALKIRNEKCMQAAFFAHNINVERPAPSIAQPTLSRGAPLFTVIFLLPCVRFSDFTKLINTGLNPRGQHSPESTKNLHANGFGYKFARAVFFFSSCADATLHNLRAQLEPLIRSNRELIKFPNAKSGLHPNFGHTGDEMARSLIGTNSSFVSAWLNII